MQQKHKTSYFKVILSTELLHYQYLVGKASKLYHLVNKYYLCHYINLLIFSRAIWRDINLLPYAQLCIYASAHLKIAECPSFFNLSLKLPESSFDWNRSATQKIYAVQFLIISLNSWLPWRGPRLDIFNNGSYFQHWNKR